MHPYGSVEEIFKKFQLDPVYGFVSSIDRSKVRLPEKYQPWEDIAADLPALATSGKLRQRVDNVNSSQLTIDAQL